MMRAIVDFVVLMIAFAILRSVISALVKGFNGSNDGPSRTASGNAPRRAPKTDLNGGGELRRDPVCGTYVAVASSLHRNVGGLTEYFCSKQCMDRYKAA